LSFVHGQQLPIFTDVQMNHQFSNPSFLSLNYLKYERNIDAAVLYRQQWIQAPDAPRTMVANFNYHNPSNGLTLGGNILKDQAGGFGDMALNLRSSYLLKVSNVLRINFGMSAGIHQYRVDATNLKFQEQGDIAMQNQAKIWPDIGVGTTAYLGDHYYFGFSVPQVFGLRSEFGDFKVTRVQHFYAVGGGVLPVYDEGFFEFHAWSRYVLNTKFQYGLNVKRSYRNVLWVGFSGASSGEVSLELGLTPGGASISYAYNMYMNSYGYNFGPSHEVRFGFAFER